MATDPFLGEIILFAGNFAPRNWAFCHGQLLPISQNTALFSILGTQYGGDGRTTFALPDLRGRVPIGTGQGPGLSSYPSNGQKGGAETHTLSEAEMPQHDHPIQLQLFGSSDVAYSQSPAGGVPATSPEADAFAADTNLTPMAAGAANSTVLNAGASQAHNNMQPYLSLNYIIALYGTFPSRW
jgi:microcystin-dependent protein